MADVRYPKKWKEMSVDIRLMFGYHISMMVMMMDGGSLTVRQELTIAGTIAALIVLVSRYRRKKKHWRWPGVKPLDVLYAVGGIVLISLFLYSATPLFPPNNGRFVPWYLAGLGIGLFAILQSLKVVYAAETDFASNCMIIDQYGRELEPIRAPSDPIEADGAKWKGVTKAVYSVSFILVWVCCVASFYFFGTAFKNGSPELTTTQTEPLEDHGKTVYVTSTEKKRVHVLQLVSWVGFPIVLLGGAGLHFLAGVKLFPNTPTLAEYL
jgi:amino acid transporter